MDASSTHCRAQGRRWRGEEEERTWEARRDWAGKGEEEIEEAVEKGVRVGKGGLVDLEVDGCRGGC